MGGDLISDIISILILIYGFNVLPLHYTAIAQEIQSEHIIQVELENIVDEIADSGELTDAMLEDFNLALGSTSQYVRVNVTREFKHIDAVPTLDGSIQTKTVYTPTDDIYHYKQGDLVTIEVHRIGSSYVESIARLTSGYAPVTDTWSVSRRVR